MKCTVNCITGRGGGRTVGTSLQWRSLMTSLFSYGSIFPPSCVWRDSWYCHSVLHRKASAVKIVLLQGKNGGLHVAWDVLLTFQQFKTTVEDPSMYIIEEEMAVLFEKVSLPLSAFLVPLKKTQSWPPSIAVWNSLTHTLEAMNLSVSR